MPFKRASGCGRACGCGRRCMTAARGAGLLVVLLLSLLTQLPTVAHATAQDTPNQLPTQAGNPLVFGIAGHAWWLDPAAFGDRLLPALDDLQVTTVRLSIDWRRFEPAQGVWDWGMYDRVLGALAERQIVIVADFNTIPPWASTDAAGCADPAQEIGACQLREDMRPAFAAAARAALTRYAWIEHWEFWNEPEMWSHLGGEEWLRNLRVFYDSAHALNPEVTVAASTLAGTGFMDWIYNVSGLWYGDGHEPWDAIAYHPYNLAGVTGPDGQPLPIRYDEIERLRALMVARGDAAKRIWITEYGWNGTPATQARNLSATLDWLKQQPYIAFAHLHMLHDWSGDLSYAFGLLALVPGLDGVVRLTPDATFTPRQPFYDAFKQAARDGLPAAPEAAGGRAFSATGHSVAGRFLAAWLTRGGLRVLGYPLTRPYPRQQPDGSWLLTQDFERARLEFHPELAGTPWEVLGQLAGNDATSARRAEPAFQPLAVCQPDAERECFAETGHSLAYGFRAFWQQHGGLATFGYPISEELRERNPDTGLVYTVQYFERARLEYHPEYAGSDYAVLLGRLIGNQLDAVGWTTSDDLRLPTRREFQ